MDLNQDMFREFSIRGIADQDLIDDVVEVIGQAIGTFFRQTKGELLVIGQDVRNSSARISQSLIRGILSTGLRVIDVGAVPTPVHNFATDLHQADGGVMVTASHNPPEYNGLKIRSDRTLNGAEIQEIYHLAIQRLRDKSRHAHDAGPSSTVEGQVEQIEPLPEYLERVRLHADSRALSARPLKVVIDGGNGTNGSIVAQLLADLGCEVVELYCKPDGNFPNRSPDPTAPGAIADLTRRVQAEKADLGLAYDGDGDRLVLVDERGKIHFGDTILMLLARHVAQSGDFKVVYDISSTQALVDDIIAHGGQPCPAQVGYAFVHHKMREIGATLGGESSGHFFCLDNDFRFDDAILASVKLLNYVTDQGQPLSRLIADLPHYHISPNYRIYCPEDSKALIIQSILDHYQATHSVDKIDGARIFFEHGWALVRRSNTQPALTFRTEGKTAADKESIKAEVLAVVNQELAKLGLERVNL